MKKLFSLAMVTGMLLLMSFSGSDNKEVTVQKNLLPPSEELQDSCYLMATCVAWVVTDDMDAQYELFGQLYDKCINQ